MEIDPICLAYAPLVSWVADWLKRWPLLKQYPKLAALLLAFIIPWLQGIVYPAGAVPIAQIIACALLTLAGAIVTHEAITEPVQRWRKARANGPIS